MGFKRKVLKCVHVQTLLKLKEMSSFTEYCFVFCCRIVKGTSNLDIDGHQRTTGKGWLVITQLFCESLFIKYLIRLSVFV